MREGQQYHPDLIADRITQAIAASRRPKTGVLVEALRGWHDFEERAAIIAFENVPPIDRRRAEEMAAEGLLEDLKRAVIARTPSADRIAVAAEAYLTMMQMARSDRDPEIMARLFGAKPTGIGAPPGQAA